MSGATRSLPVDALDKDIYNSGRDVTGEWGGDETAEVGFGIGGGEEGEDLDVCREGTALSRAGEGEDGGAQLGEVVRGERAPEVEHCEGRQCTQRVDLQRLCDYVVRMV